MNAMLDNRAIILGLRAARADKRGDGWRARVGDVVNFVILLWLLAELVLLAAW